MSRNLITRLGTASGLVAALVAAVFLVLTAAVREQRSSDRRARQAELVIAVATQVQLSHGVALRAAADRLQAVVPGGELGPARTIAQDAAALAAGGESPPASAALRAGLDRAARAIVAAEQSEAARRRHQADSAATRAIDLGIGGVIGSTALIALLTAYLANNIVVPLRRVNRAAGVLAGGDLGERVVESGDAEARELARSFNAMAANLQESEQLKDEFFALVSHELRTPLTSIIGYVELVLDDEALGTDAHRFLEIVHRNAQRLLRLVGDMLFVAQMEAGRLSLHREQIALQAIVVDSVDAARPAAERAGVALELVVEAHGGPDFVFGDRDRLAQALDNLISNALKFSARGAAATVRLGREGQRAIIEVIDTGDGIPALEQEEVFERFHRSATAIDQGVPGAGLGLAVVKTIIEGHGGSVALRSAVGEGTTVRVELPILQAPEAAVL